MNSENSTSDILKRHFDKLKKQNSRFSIRGLAKKLGVNHSFLVRILKGMARIPVKLIADIIKHLKIDEFDAQELYKSTLYERSKIPKKSLYSEDSFSGSNTQGYTLLPESHFGLLRNWWNFAILDLLTCEMGMKFTPEVIAGILPVPINEIKISLVELQKFGLVSENHGSYFKAEKNLHFQSRGPNPFLRTFYKQCLKLAEAKLNDSSQAAFEKRLVMGFSCAVNKKNIPLAKQRLAAALRECALILAAGPCDDVYFVQGQLFSVTKE